MKKIILALAAICALATGTFAAQCNPIFPAGQGWGSLTGVYHAYYNSPAGSYPDPAIGSWTKLVGTFPGVTSQLFYVGSSPVYQAQGLRVYVDDDCHQARLNHVSSSEIGFQMPANLSPGIHTVYLYKTLYGGYVRHQSISVVRWKPAMRFTPNDSDYGQPNAVFGLVFARNPGGTVRLIGPIQQGVPLSSGVAGNETIILRINAVGAYKGSDNPSLSASFGGTASPAVALFDYTVSPYFAGQQYLNIDVPASVKLAGGIWNLTFAVGGSTTPLQAVLNF